MENLLEDYKRKLKTVIDMLNADTITPETIQRLTVKKGMIASFIVDIERAMADVETVNSGLHLQRVSGCFSFAKYVNGWYEYADNTENGDVYNNVVTGRLMTEQQIFDEWLKLNNR